MCEREIEEREKERGEKEREREREREIEGREGGGEREVRFTHAPTIMPSWRVEYILYIIQECAHTQSIWTSSVF